MLDKNTHKQAFYFTIINYVGILIGIVSTLFIYPKNKEMLGVLRYIENISAILFPIMVLGVSQALINFSPKLDNTGRRKLFNYSFISIIAISLILLLVFFVSSFLPFLNGIKYVYFAFPIALFLAFIELFKKQSSIIQKIAIPTFFDNIIPKIAVPVIFLLTVSGLVSKSQSIYLFILSYGIIFCCLGFYLFHFFKPKIDFDFNVLFENFSKNDYYKFSIFAFAGSLGSVFAFRIDTIIIKHFFSFESVGTFSIGVTLASSLAIPATGLFALNAPTISNFLKRNMLSELNTKYKENAKLLFFIGALIYSCIFFGIEDLFLVLPTHENLMASVPIILILGFNVLINMGTGFNGEIITYSKYYKFNLIAILILIIVNIALNLLFIVHFKFGIESVAYASLIAMVAFNFAKLIFIYKKFKLLPFDEDYLKLVAVFSFSTVIVSILPDLENSLYNLMFKIFLILALNLSIIFKLKLVYSFNFWVDSLLKKIF